jgi:hypothetical protein
MLICTGDANYTDCLPNLLDGNLTDFKITIMWGKLGNIVNFLSLSVGVFFRKGEAGRGLFSDGNDIKVHYLVL